MVDQPDPNRPTPTNSDPSIPLDSTAPSSTDAPPPSSTAAARTSPTDAPSTTTSPTDAARQSAVASGKLDPLDPTKPTTTAALADVQNAAHDAELRSAADAETQRRNDRSFVCPTCGSSEKVETVPCPECSSSSKPGRRIVTNAVGEQIDYGVCPRCNGTKEMFMAGPRTLASPRPKQQDAPATNRDNVTTTGASPADSSVPANDQGRINESEPQVV